ncbi:probable arginine--tRNA ligase, mitochondrial [Frankliniella occidentalis]|uniref:Probable arginine--tRNA ligase, mitochondrial n=1 Tax=Frankliniella occidentalis TaxID=133901 RepID=A0A6J1TJ19_FRAOC|nr:probable arginine--tRNA ligase, mitochondrial [Frankliniella occidentalis]
MSKYLKNQVSLRLLDALARSNPSEIDSKFLASKMLLRKHSDSQIGLVLPVDCVNVTNSSNWSNVKDCIAPDDVISSVSIIKQQGKPNLFFHLNQNNFIKNILEHHAADQPSLRNSKRVLVEFSSPNIAKPIHVGHLRSTIIGNFIANIHEWFGYDVMRINYLGDWGTQFGLVKVGMKILNPTQEELTQRPLSTLYQAYILANTAAENNPQILDDARQIFLNLERGVSDDISDWILYKKYTVEELKKIYSRLNIVFDHYCWESDYKVDCIGHILELLKSTGGLATDKEGRSVMNLDGKDVPLLKSDGTTLYLTRDVAAAVDRKNRFQFDKMYYLADTSQHRHFRNLFSILKVLSFPWAENMEHVRFGRVRGMSTRRGEAVFLNDILDEAHYLMIKQQQTSPNTKINLDEDKDTADILGVSAIIVADLIHKRMRDYSFDWDSAKSVTGNTGVRMQYTHCRLKSLSDKFYSSSGVALDPLLLSEPTAINLVFEISRFEEALERSFEELEASKLTDYLFSLCDAINKAFMTLKVSNTGKLGEQRLILFEEARSVLHRGMTLLGLKPLNRM